MNLDFRSPAARGLRRYVRLVADVLDPDVDRTAVHWVHPVRAHLALSGRLRWFPGREVTLTWDEWYGWAMAVAACTDDSPTVLRYLGNDVLPAPRDVARFSGRMFRDEFVGLPDPPARAAQTDVTTRLSEYAVHCHARHRRQNRPVHLYGVITSRQHHA